MSLYYNLKTGWIKIRHSQISERTIHKEFINLYGGFISYCKLTFQLYLVLFNIIPLLFKKMFELQEIIKERELNFVEKEYPRITCVFYLLYSFLILLVKTPYFIFIKPVAYFFKKKTIYSGKYFLENGYIKKHNINKTVTYYYLSFPFWFSSTSNINDNDWEMIIN